MRKYMFGKQLLKNDRIEVETSLLDYGGTTNKNVDYIIHPDRSGIELKGFELNDHIWTVGEVIQYRPWNFGRITPGSGQLGIYKLVDQNGVEAWALIKDYAAFEGDWRIMIERLEPNEEELRQFLMMDQIGATFYEFLFKEKFLK